MNIRENLIIDIETEVSDSESDSKTLKFLVDEDLKDLGYNVHSLQVQPAKRHRDTNGVLPLTEKELEEYYSTFGYESSSVGVLRAVSILDDGLYAVVALWERKEGCRITNYKAILWLAERFELEVER